jgi:hypothetical protein
MNNILLNESEIIANELNGQNDWTKISKSGDLTEEQLIQYKNKLDWFWVLTRQQDISNKLLDQLIQEGILDINERTTIEHISENHANDLEFIRKYKDKLYMGKVLKRNNFKISIVKDLVRKPEVGMGATVGYVNDRYPYTIIEVNKAGTRIKLQQDFAEPDKENGYEYFGNQVYIISPNPNGSIYEMSLRKNGKWKVIGGSTTATIGHRDRYENPSF